MEKVKYHQGIYHWLGGLCLPLVFSMTRQGHFTSGRVSEDIGCCFFSKTQRVLPDSDQQCQKSKVLYRSLSLHCFFLKQGLPLCLLYFIILPLLESKGSSSIFRLLKIGLSLVFNSMWTNQIFCFYALALDPMIVFVWFGMSR